MVIKSGMVTISNKYHILRLITQQIAPLTRSYFKGASLSVMDTVTMNKKVENQKLFVEDKQAKSYANYRPTYPDEVFETIIKYCKSNEKERRESKLAVDVGCGPGQSTLPLTNYFSQVIGLDVSQKQISNAPINVPGLTFQVSTAEDLNCIKDKSVDLVTIGQALHWLQLDRFYSEVDRVLRPGGSVVAYGYGIMSIDHPKVHDYLTHIYGVRLSSYWGKDREHVENKYSCLPSPYGSWLRNDDLVMEKNYTIEELVGYLNSWSSVRTYSQQNPKEDLIEEIRIKLSSICHQADEKVLTVRWPIFMLMAHKP